MNGFADTFLLHTRQALSQQFGAGELLLVHPGQRIDASCHRPRANPQTITLGSGSLIVGARRKVALSAAIARHCERVDESALCCLLAFLDPVFPRVSGCNRQNPVWMQEVPEVYGRSTHTLQHWLALLVMQGRSNPLLQHLRFSESYRIASYLVQGGVGTRHLKAQSRQYGVSYSYFRRLCSRALGGQVKPRLSQWRAARAAVALVYGNATVLNIALENGYSCSAHISRDIKKNFGVTPSSLMKAHALLP
jgi:AraC-like DNA-binding protein